MGELITGGAKKWGRLISGGAYNQGRGNFLCPFYGAIVNDRRIIKSYFDVKTTCFVLR